MGLAAPGLERRSEASEGWGSDSFWRSEGGSILVMVNLKEDARRGNASERETRLGLIGKA